MLQTIIASLTKAYNGIESDLFQVRQNQAEQRWTIEDLKRRVQRVEERDGSDKKS